MSTSLLDHASGVRGDEYVRTEYLGGRVIFTFRQGDETLRCPACGARDARSKGQVE